MPFNVFSILLTTNHKQKNCWNLVVGLTLQVSGSYVLTKIYYKTRRGLHGEGVVLQAFHSNEISFDFISILEHPR